MDPTGIAEMIAAAQARYDAMSDDERAICDYEQRRSFVRGMCPSDQDYDVWCMYVDRLIPPQGAR